MPAVTAFCPLHTVQPTDAQFHNIHQSIYIISDHAFLSLLLPGCLLPLGAVL